MKRSRQDKQYENERALLDRVREVYREAVQFKRTSADTFAFLKRVVYDSPEMKSLPQYRRHAVRKLAEHLFHGPADMSIYQYLEYRMLYKGKYYAKFDAWRAQFPDADASEIEQGNHFWIGTDKAY